MLKADGFDDAVIGVGVRCGFDDVIVYDYDKCVDILVGNIKDDSDEAEYSDEDAYIEAIDHMEYNVVGGYVGTQTPLFLHPQTLEEIEESYD